MRQRNFVAKHNTHKGGVHGRTFKAERKEMKDHLMEQAEEEYEDIKELEYSNVWGEED